MLLIYMLLLVVPLSVVALSLRFSRQSFTRNNNYISKERFQPAPMITFLGSSPTTSVAKMDQRPGLAEISKFHIIILVHGWLGNPKEMDYLKQTLSQQLRQIAVNSTKDHDLNAAANAFVDKNFKDSNPIALAIPSSKNSTSYEAFIVHCAEANKGRDRTSDGIAAGGQRLATEIDQIISQYSEQYQSQDQPQRRPPPPPPPITLSLVGNSLGGLYCRYAISRMNCLSPTNNQGIVVIPKLFITTCTPHLGVSQHTYLSIPSWIETPIAWIMQQTGQDLFRRSLLLQDMTVHPTFLRPLQSFTHRIAYANVYGTDFQVPTSTAAFWADTNSIHQLFLATPPPSSNYRNNNNNIVLTLSTPRKECITMQEEWSTVNDLSSRELSVRLDQLGWTKVLVDVRQHLPWSFGTAGKRSTPTTGKESSSSVTTTSRSTTKATTWTARELLQEFDRGHFQVFPLGHTVMVANAKDSINQYLTKGGQSTMDYLARTILNVLLEHEHGNDDDTKENGAKLQRAKERS